MAKVTKRDVWTFLVVVVAAVAIKLLAPGLFHKSKPDKPEPIETAQAEIRAIDQIVNATGEVAAAQATDIKSEVSGRIDKLNVKMGDVVKIGDVLMELNVADLRSEHAEAELQLESATIRREKIHLDYERKKKLREQSFVMEKDLQEASIDLRLSDNEIQLAGARVRTIAEKLAKAVIRAPHDGTVLNFKARVGVVVSGAESAGESTLLMQIADLSQLQIQTTINEVDVTKVSMGMEATVTFDSLPGVIAKGTVSSVSLSAIPADKDKTVRVFPIVVVLAPSDAPIKSGITGNVSIITAQNPKALTVVSSAVFFDGNQPILFVETGGKFEKRPAELGITDHAHVEIRKGLKEGETVALQRPPEFAEGPAEHSSNGAD